ncbi:MAG TPA: hypothetical protein VGR35_02775 [Tepidisphaeraceae bacterium]|nr:hypothetical protein [Tepidisphaeraceae bacterium]
MADAIATAADYADAIMTARRAKNTLFLLLLLILLTQLTLFFVGRYTDVNFADDAATVEATVITSTADVTTQPAVAGKWRAVDLLEYLVSATAFLGIAMTIVLAVVLLLIVKIMLVGRLIGVARLTSAFIWTVVLAVLLFPWQAFWEDYSFKLPGVLYTWDELVRRVKLQPERDDAVLFWARFVGLPVLALIILLVIQVKSRRGLQQALGEANYDSTSAPLA